MHAMALLSADKGSLSQTGLSSNLNMIYVSECVAKAVS